MAEINIDDILKGALRAGASDVHLKVNCSPVFRVDGKLIFVKDAPKVSDEDMQNIALSMMNARQKEKFEKSNEMDLAYSITGLSRFRVNIFQQRGTPAIAIRAIPYNIRNFFDLNLPPVLEKIAQEERGLVIVTGTTGSGKSTTLAAIVDYINATRARHIITIEDPLEYLHGDKKSYVNQREVGIDTLSFSNALRASLREDPDVILVGEMRDLETMEIAIAAAETGHLVFTTLHTLDAQETINRILAAFPPNQQNQIRYQLSQVLKAIISQRLVPMADAKGRVPAAEVLIATARIKELISDPARTKEIRTAIEEGNLYYGMQTFDQCLFDLYQKGLIAYDEVMRQATNKDDLALRISGITSGADARAGEIDRLGKEKLKKTEELQIRRS
ncbi:MAG: type IV pilus twitching motility protein PilT [Ignavibacteriales bacterium]